MRSMSSRSGVDRSQRGSTLRGGSSDELAISRILPQATDL